MSEGVFTRMKRLEFVEKLSSEVGDGTAWPLLVTQDQLAEILYRVKDSAFSGSVTETLGGVTVEFGFSGDPANALVAEDSAYDYLWFSRRGYSATDVDGFEGYFGEGYSVGETEYFDIADKEKGVWAPPVNEGFSFRTGLTHEFTVFSEGGLESDPLPDHYLAYNKVDSSISPAQALLQISGEVAWVDVNGSGNPFDPENELYLALQLDMFGTLYFSTSLSTNAVEAGNSVATGVQFEIGLSTSDLAIPIYFTTGDGSASYSGAIRLDATEWWPYAKIGGDVWDADTGIKT